MPLFWKICKLFLALQIKIHNKMVFTGFFLQLKLQLRGFFCKSYCYYGNLLCYENNNVFPNDWAVFCDTMIVASTDKESF